MAQPSCCAQGSRKPQWMPEISVTRMSQVVLAWPVMAKLRMETRDFGPPPVLTDRLPETAAEPRESAELDERLLRLLERLEPEDRHLMQMHLDGYSNKEIGAAMGLSPAAAAMRKARIVHEMKQLAKRMNKNRH